MILDDNPLSFVLCLIIIHYSLTFDHLPLLQAATESVRNFQLQADLALLDALTFEALARRGRLGKDPGSSMTSKADAVPLDRSREKATLRVDWAYSMT